MKNTRNRPAAARRHEGARGRTARRTGSVPAGGPDEAGRGPRTHRRRSAGRQGDTLPGRPPQKWVQAAGRVALAAVAASAVAVTTLDWREPADRPSAQPRSSAATELPGAGEDVHVDGHLELLSAAEQAANSADQGTYWQTTTRSENVDVAGEQGHLFAVRSTSTSEWSVGVRPGTGSLMVSGLDSLTEPRTAADKARWRAAGSPGTVRVEVAKKAGTGVIGYPMGTGRPMVMKTNLNDKIYAVGPRKSPTRTCAHCPPPVGSCAATWSGRTRRTTAPSPVRRAAAPGCCARRPTSSRCP